MSICFADLARTVTFSFEESRSCAEKDTSHRLAPALLWNESMYEPHDLLCASSFQLGGRLAGQNGSCRGAKWIPF